MNNLDRTTSYEPRMKNFDSFARKFLLNSLGVNIYILFE